MKKIRKQTRKGMTARASSAGSAGECTVAQPGLSLRDLAKMAGVDVSTASRSLRGDPRISRERVEAIRKIAEKIGYRPRPLRGKRTRAIALLLPTERAGNPYLQRLLWMVERAATKRGLHMNVEFIAPDRERVTLPAIVAQNRVDGVLLAGYPPTRVVELIREAGVPMAAINESVARLGVSSLCSRSASVFREVVLRLAAWGHRRIGVALTQRKFPTMMDRYRAWMAAMEYVNIEPDPALMLEGLADDLSGGREAVERFCEQDDPPTAVIFGNDWMALGAMCELSQRGLRVPDAMSVVGSGDYPLCATAKPALTTFAIDEVGIGQSAVQLLVDEIEGGGTGRPRKIDWPQHVVWRESTGPLMRTA
ncbi:MAG: LacI family transcriptional regulator [Opitutaceae bacterium]|jgi:LacI family transcriptional regulator|nr:LacI family transcriptional regulator [Opitutaceae bacterium]